MIVQHNAPLEDGVDYSKKWYTSDGQRAMEQVLDLAASELRFSLDEITNRSVNTRVRGDWISYRQWLRVGGAAFQHFSPRDNRFVNWARRIIKDEPPIFSQTFGQMFETVLLARGLQPFSSGPVNTYWTASWVSPQYDPMTMQALEGYCVLTRVGGWDIAYREDRSLGLTGGMYDSGRIQRGRFAKKTEGVLTRTAAAHIYRDAAELSITGTNFDVLTSRARLNEYAHRYGDETYASAVEGVIQEAHLVADFMNDFDFHQLETLKRQLRRYRDSQETIETPLFSSLQKTIDPGAIPLVGEAAQMSDQLQLGKRARDLYKMALSGRWDGKGWEAEALKRHMDLESLRPDESINYYYPLKVGWYPPKYED